MIAARKRLLPKQHRQASAVPGVAQEKRLPGLEGSRNTTGKRERNASKRAMHGLTDIVLLSKCNMLCADIMPLGTVTNETTPTCKGYHTFGDSVGCFIMCMTTYT